MSLFTVLCVVTLLAFAGRAPSQFMIKKDQPPLPLDAKQGAEAIEKLLKELDDNYVFPETAKKMGEIIRQHVADKRYEGLKTGQELAKKLTDDLQAVSKDKHLRVICSTEKLPPPSKGKKPSPEEVKKMRGRMAKMNGGFVKAERLPGNVGYLELTGFMNPEAAAGPAAAAMTFLANTDALVIDLRRNGGGSPETVALLCSYFFGEEPVHLNSLYWRKGDRTEKFFTRKKLDGPRYLDKDVYVLTSKRTFSGAEEFTYNLKNLKRATIVGETTGGGAHPGGVVPVGDHFAAFIPTGRAISPITNTNWEGTGVAPDIAVPVDQALDTAHRRAVERLLERAPDDETRRLIRADLDRAAKEKATKAP
jgi:C-terminal processing protease CtpA/Prc